MRVLVSGGGTGGHIYPALALIRRTKEIEPDTEFLYVGTEKGLESTIVPPTGIPFQTIQIQGFKRSLSLDNVKTVHLFLKSIQTAKQIIKAFKPDIVVGTGGYVCSSMIYAANKLNVPTIIHEQNSVPGMTNKFLAKYASKICLAFAAAASYFPKNKIEIVGNPRAQEVYGIEKKLVLEDFSLDNSYPTVLLFGGSRGAKKINDAFLTAVKNLGEKPYQILYVSGNFYYKENLEKIAHDPKTSRNISIQPYIQNMQEVLTNVDLVVSRAGATSLAEITALGLPSILVPSPNVTNDHQTKNAETLVQAGAAILLKDAELTGQTLTEAIDKVMTNNKLKENMANRAQELAQLNASDQIYQIIKELIL